MQIIMPRNKKWSDLTTKQKAPFVLRGVIQFALLAAVLVDVYRRPEGEINGSKWLWSALAFANFMGIGPVVSLRPQTPSDGATTRHEKGSE